MSDFHQNGVITTFHNLRTRSIEQQEEEVRAYAKQRPVTLVLPSLYSELQGKALEHIVQILGELDYLDHIVVGIDRANQERQKGLDIDEALLNACPRRLRPILMTSLTLILAMMMPALGIGSGVELSQPLAIAVVGGMISSTFLSLVIVPIIYSWAEKRKLRKRLYNLERRSSSSTL